MADTSSPLAGTTWVLRHLHDPDESVRSTPAGEEILTFGLDSVRDNHGNSASARIGDQSVSFGPWINDLAGRFGGPVSVPLSIEEQRFLFTVLHGETTWAMSGRELLIEKDDVGSVSLSAVD